MQALSWIAVAVAGAALAYVLRRPKQVGLRPHDRVFVFGDSICAGIAGPLGVLADRELIQIASDSVVGSTISDWATKPSFRAKIDSAVSSNPTIVLIVLGTNDSAMSAAALDADLPKSSDLVRACSAGGAKVWWVLPPGLPQFPNRARVVAAVSGGGVRTIVTDGLSCARAPDHVHFTPVGYQCLSEHIWAMLKIG